MDDGEEDFRIWVIRGCHIYLCYGQWNSVLGVINSKWIYKWFYGSLEV